MRAERGMEERRLSLSLALSPLPWVVLKLRVYAIPMLSYVFILDCNSLDVKAPERF
jgi:hypothetical protein